MKIAVIGSRTIKDPRDVLPQIENLEFSLLVTGGAPGVDTIAERWAVLCGIPVQKIRPNYHRDGAKAPLLRNEKIVRAADLIVAIWDGKSSGTLHAVNYARRQGKKVKCINVNEKSLKLEL